MIPDIPRKLLQEVYILCYRRIYLGNIEVPAQLFYLPNYVKYVQIEYACFVVLVHKYRE